LLGAFLKKLQIYKNQIHFLENANDDVVEKLLLESFVLLHPSRREGYGLVLVEAAYAGTANILINYPENASTELGINPTLVCSDDKIETLVEKLNNAYADQVRLRRITEDWVRNASITRTYRESCLTLESTLKKLST
jgi:glycosyltransferase involved in cell wall biosynthesis